jgi:hypothetical protein
LTRSHLGPDAFEEAWLTGSSAALDEAVRVGMSDKNESEY